MIIEVSIHLLFFAFALEGRVVDELAGVAALFVSSWNDRFSRIYAMRCGGVVR